MIYRRISDVNFKRVSFFLLGLSGAGAAAEDLRPGARKDVLAERETADGAIKV